MNIQSLIQQLGRNSTAAPLQHAGPAESSNHSSRVESGCTKCNTWQPLIASSCCTYALSTGATSWTAAAESFRLRLVLHAAQAQARRAAQIHRVAQTGIVVCLIPYFSLLSSLLT
jgi:hypothetical protein